MLKTIWIIVVLILTVIVAIFIFNRDDSIAIPDGLYGYWITHNAKYADRYFDLSEAVLKIGFENEDIGVYTVKNIKGKKEEGRIIYEVTFIDNEDVEYTQSFYFNKNGKESLVFKNQMGIVWHKDADHR